MYGQTLGRSRTAWSRSSVMSLGKLVMNLIRSIPSMSEVARASPKAGQPGRQDRGTDSC